MESAEPINTVQLVSDATPPLTALHEQYLAEDPDYLAEDMAIHVAEEVARILEFRGLPQIELARRMKVSRSYVSRFLGAPPNMTLRSIANVGLALGVQPRVVFPSRIESHVIWPREAHGPQFLPGFEPAGNPHIAVSTANDSQKPVNGDSEWPSHKNFAHTFPQSAGTSPEPSGIQSPPPNSSLLLPSFSPPSTVL